MLQAMAGTQQEDPQMSFKQQKVKSAGSCRHWMVNLYQFACDLHNRFAQSTLQSLRAACLYNKQFWLPMMEGWQTK